MSARLGPGDWHAARLRACNAGLALGMAFALAGAGPALEARAQAGQDFELTPLAPGVWMHAGRLEEPSRDNSGDVANLGVVAGMRCVAVIDTGGAPEIGRALRQAVARVTPLPVCFVVHTHAHPDHVLGSVAFLPASAASPPDTERRSPAAPPIRFVAAARFERALAVRGPYYLHALTRDLGVPRAEIGLPPTGIEVEDRLELDLGGRRLALRAWPTAHTDNDLSVFDATSGTLFAGDLLFAQHLPVLDGSLRGWLDALDLLKNEPATRVTRVVPGHGPVSGDWPGALDPELRYLRALLRDTRQAVRDGASLPEAVERVRIADPGPWMRIDRFHRRNVTAAFAELEWEPPASLPTPERQGGPRP